MSNWSNTSSTTSKKSREQVNKEDDLMEVEDEDDILEVPKVQNVARKRTGAPQNMDRKNRPSPSPSPALTNSSTSASSSTTYQKKNRSPKPESNLELEDEDDILEVPKVQNVARKRTGAPQNMDRKNRPSPSPSPALTNSSTSASSSTTYQKKNVGLDSSKFLADFDPQNSIRNQQKKKKRYHPNDGRLIQYAYDYEDCDCLRPNCPGCHYPCQSCKDPRCGHECRVTRKWMYESVEVEGRKQVFINSRINNFT